ncbi:Trehalose utilization [Crateriforma conspicua]|uniref:Trehalose utilization n=1 Tax=Crateriforma conspicua TaxID=2527996 RepID=A0A5C6FSD8_9PLAN|nr:family 16 glycoside hydrolase [Crateriforma conspicua]TWU63416.1 Trehalose utilization [Crateriforma conspicua]
MLARLILAVAATFGFSILSFAAAASPLKVLVIDGFNPYHDWQKTTPELTAILEGSGRFEVTVMTAPQDEKAMRQFRPDFDKFDVFVSNYNGLAWTEQTQQAFEKYIASGGGFVSVHAADNAFPQWPEYNRMIGLGGWGGRNEKSGPYVRWNDQQQRFVRDLSPGKGGAHGKRVPFLVICRDMDHPITRGLPSSFLQTDDELYSKLRGPAENMHILATAQQNPSTGGTGLHEPVLMTIHYGNGRVFHTTLGHDLTAMSGAAFQVTLLRGTEWAATGQVSDDIVDAKVLSADEAVVLVKTDAADSTEEAPAIDGEGWVMIFNGKDTTGWTQKNGTATYRIEDGVVVGKTAEGSPNSFLCTEKSYGDFELTFEVMVDPGLNSGVQIRSGTKEDTGRVYGPQVEIETAPGESGYVYGEATGRGWLSPNQDTKDAYKNDQWNRYVIRAKGDRIQTWINGTIVEDLRDAESRREGFIGLQVHGIKKGTGPYEVRWRDIRVREL